MTVYCVEAMMRLSEDAQFISGYSAILSIHERAETAQAEIDTKWLPLPPHIVMVKVQPYQVVTAKELT